LMVVTQNAAWVKPLDQMVNTICAYFFEVRDLTGARTTKVE